MHILDHITEDDIMFFISQSSIFKNSKRIYVLILNRDENFITAKIIDNKRKKLTLRFTLNDVFVAGYENLDISDSFYLNVKLCWRSYLYLLFKELYLYYLNENKENNKIYEYIGVKCWPLVREKDALIRKL